MEINTVRPQMVFQDPFSSLDPRQTVGASIAEPLMLAARASGAPLSRGELRGRVCSVLEQVGLGDQIHKKPNQMSGGQMQRVAIARTLILKPDIMLFDEPASALDVATRLQLRTVIKDIQAKFGTTMIYITHDQEEAFAMADRIMVMENARISQIGTPSEIVGAPANDYVKSFVVDNLQTKIASLSKALGADA